jgi:hypothetical protein
MRRGACIISLSFLMLLGACGYAHKNFDQAGGTLVHQYDFVIQVDDYGSFWDPEIPAHALEAIAHSARTTNTIVILVVHGWHHSAAPEDEFAMGFAKALQDIRNTLQTNVDGKPNTYRRARQLLTGSGEVNIFGIYVGWRGLSLPGALNYITFWDRKDAAEHLGNGDLREFLLRLNIIYRTSYQDRKPWAPFVGLASFGHSLGAQVLFAAISSTLENELIEATHVSHDPAAPRQSLAKPLEGFGDIVILVNPALEAFQFERVRKLSAQLAYDRRQPPLLLVISADTDVARHVFFPARRWIDRIFNVPPRDEQSDLWSYALGEYEPQRTHMITFLPEQQAFGLDFYVSDPPAGPCDIVNLDLTNMPTLSRVRLEPIAGRHNPFSPFLVAYGGKELIRGHSGIFQQELLNFMNTYVAIARGKRLLLANPAMQYCPEPAQ